jgi:hypothetical protein
MLRRGVKIAAAALPLLTTLAACQSSPRLVKVGQVSISVCAEGQLALAGTRQRTAWQTSTVDIVSEAAAARSFAIEGRTTPAVATPAMPVEPARTAPATRPARRSPQAGTARTGIEPKLPGPPATATRQAGPVETETAKGRTEVEHVEATIESEPIRGLVGQDRAKGEMATDRLKGKARAARSKGQAFADRARGTAVTQLAASRLKRDAAKGRLEQASRPARTDLDILRLNLEIVRTPQKMRVLPTEDIRFTVTVTNRSESAVEELEILHACGANLELLEAGGPGLEIAGHSKEEGLLRLRADGPLATGRAVSFRMRLRLKQQARQRLLRGQALSADGRQTESHVAAGASLRCPH